MSKAYTLDYSRRAREALKRMDRSSATRILTKLVWLALNAANYPHEAMAGNWAGFLRFRTRQVIEVEAIGHRREIYDK